MNVRSILKTTLLNSFQWIVLPIRTGELKSKRWTISSSSKFLRGNYEREKVTLFKSHLKSGHVVYDLGAHMGYYSLVASQAVGSQGRVLAFEPLPFNLRQLRRHVTLNRCHNVTVVDACVGETPGTVRFTSDLGSGTNHVSGHGNLTVKMVSIDSLVEARTIPLPDCIKIDIEGSELAALKGAQSTIIQTHPLLFVSFHGTEMKQQCSALLESWGYRQQNGVWVHNHPS